MRPWQSKAGYIGRVITAGDEHVCGICRSRSLERDRAEACFARCWDNLLQMDPVITKSKKDFACRFCARVYGSYDAAKACSAVCRTHAVVKHEKEQAAIAELVTGVPANASPRPAVKTTSPSVVAAAPEPTPAPEPSPTPLPTLDEAPTEVDDDSFLDEDDFEDMALISDQPPPPAVSNTIAERLEDWADIDTDVEDETLDL